MFLGDMAQSRDASSSSKNIVGLCVLMEVILLSSSLPSFLPPSFPPSLTPSPPPLSERAIKIKHTYESKTEHSLLCFS